MSKRPVSLSHFVCVIPLFDRVPLSERRIFDFRCEIVYHCSPAILRKSHDPSHRKGDLTLLRYLDRDLISRATNTTRLDLKPRLGIFQRLVKGIQGVDRVRTFPAPFDRLVHNTLRDRLFAATHDRADQTGNDWTAIPAVQRFDLMNDSA